MKNVFAPVAPPGSLLKERTVLTQTGMEREGSVVAPLRTRVCFCAKRCGADIMECLACNSWDVTTAVINVLVPECSALAVLVFQCLAGQAPSYL